MPRSRTSDIGTLIEDIDARENYYTLSQTHGSPVCTLSLRYTKRERLVFSAWSAQQLGSDLLRFARTASIATDPTGPEDYMI